ncbi:DUF2971 domain-containing protein [Pseudomonas chlororaphis]|uniref:Protein of uncharacterized function (DUF2971) n=1 Tax=Pseudomonas chlororaphis TaxID=587753 RepID=A0AAX3G131_9PSED|nr:DUF2971 domain-containing protein [Pseudomonas chlororaphis]AZC35837.1 hypothetical protein C4K37_1433 [Pseudomonas chlororaphis subsp. piscium]AZC42381.1 hypothetical protein C4K36_1439 [Pseudomonas chlororaphis subsp. piscium]WDG74305.1 DUF2971 domain-containing protein [Pseudomonas chlororaphis]WDH28058.1 DUF2971 domain-containing protein [Pseudomonas chlororaphis]WDH72826.1 DUF2971 domain-containing protein [Pseudomonas chlororaphis]
MSVDKIEKLLKFLPAEDYVLDSLKGETVWFSYLKNLNDPFEGNVRFSKLEREDVINVYLEVVVSKGGIAPAELPEYRKVLEMDRHYEGLVEAIGEIEKDTVRNIMETFSTFSCCRVMSGSSVAERTNEILMWAHYTKSFRGLCLDFDFHVLDKSLRELNGDEAMGNALINYEHEMYEVDFPKFMRNAIKPHQVGMDDYIKTAIFRKHSIWEYEKELRFLSGREGLFNISNEAIKGVYLGPNMDEKYREEVVTIFRSKFPYVKLYDVAPYGYGLNYKELK